MKEGTFFETGTQDYMMESVNKRHFLGTTFQMLLVYQHYITKQILHHLQLGLGMEKGERW